MVIGSICNGPILSFSFTTSKLLNSRPKKTNVFIVVMLIDDKN